MTAIPAPPLAPAALRLPHPLAKFNAKRHSRAFPRAGDFWGFPSGAQMVAAGFGAMNAYIVGNTGIAGDGSPAGIATGRAILEDYTAHGIYVWLNWELSPTAPENGPWQGQQDALAAIGPVQNLGLLDVPGARGALPIYASNDSIVSSWSAVEGYFAAWSATCISNGVQPGAYAQDSVLADVRNHGVTRFWQAGNGSSSTLPWAHIVQGISAQAYQSMGRTVDPDWIQHPGFGGINYHGMYAGTPAPPQEDDDVKSIFIRPSGGPHAQAIYVAPTDLSHKTHIGDPSDIGALVKAAPGDFPYGTKVLELTQGTVDQIPGTA